jgi:hypothetical protein
VFDSIVIHLELECSEDVMFLKNVFQVLGKSVTHLTWSNNKKLQMEENELLEMLHLMPDLEDLRMISWQGNLSTGFGTNSTTKLLKLRKLHLIGCDCSVFDCLAKTLSLNSLVELKLEGMTIPEEASKRFVGEQTTIEALDVSQNTFSSMDFHSLKLKQLRYNMPDGSEGNHRSMFKALLQSQENLESLDILWCTIDDEIFKEITELQQLTALKMNIYNVSLNSLFKIVNLINLKSLRLIHVEEESFEALSEMSLLKLPVEHLTLSLVVELPQQTYRQLGENLNLKSLSIRTGTSHEITFFLEAFPTLEYLRIRFGFNGTKVEFHEVFSGESLKVHKNMKNLDLCAGFMARKFVPVEDLSKLLSCFPNLEKLKLASRFLFSKGLLDYLTSRLTCIRSLELGVIVVEVQTVKHEMIESLKKLSTKLDYCCLNIEICTGDSNAVEQASLEQALRFNFRIERAYGCLKITSGNISQKLE